MIFLWGYLIWRDDRAKAQLTEKNRGGVWFLTLETGTPEHIWSRRRLRRQLEIMYEAGVRYVVRQGPVPAELLPAFGMSGVDVAPLRQALLPQMLDWAEDVWQIPLRNGCVRLCAEESTRPVWRAADVIARRVRYMEVDTGRGREALQEEMRRRYGLGNGGRPLLEVCLARRPRGESPVLLLGPGCGGLQAVHWEVPGSEEMPEELLAVLWQAGKLEKETVQVRSVEFRA